jgi:hypothetical protein
VYLRLFNAALKEISNETWEAKTMNVILAPYCISLFKLISTNALAMPNQNSQRPNGSRSEVVVALPEQELTPSELSADDLQLRPTIIAQGTTQASASFRVAGRGLQIPRLLLLEQEPEISTMRRAISPRVNPANCSSDAANLEYQ